LDDELDLSNPIRRIPHLTQKGHESALFVSSFFRANFKLLGILNGKRLGEGGTQPLAVANNTISLSGTQAPKIKMGLIFF
jgi:hypothetical protein